MPNIKSAKKRAVLDRKWGERNRQVRARIRTMIKRVREAEDVESAEARYRDAEQALDRAARKRLFHPNKVARVKSQLRNRVNSLR
jgi:small subunit ribosomal protein S20